MGGWRREKPNVKYLFQTSSDVSVDKPYLINIDEASTKIHLNPKYFNDTGCNLNREKNLSFGEKREITREEAVEYLTGKKQVYYKGRLFANLAVCKNCSSRCRQSVHWDIPKETLF